MDPDDELRAVAVRVKQAIRELRARGFPVVELHVGRNVARKLAEISETGSAKGIHIYDPQLLDSLIDAKNGPFEIGTIGPTIPIICLDRGDDDWCEASYRPTHSQ